jgi:hypothetical protein
VKVFRHSGRALELVAALNHAAEAGERRTFPLAGTHPKYRGWRPAKRPVGAVSKKD